MSADYLLGSSDREIERMRFQHEVWSGPTDAFLDRAGVRKGWHCLDVGAGPGFTTSDLRERVGSAGSVTALEPSGLFTDHLNSTIADRGWRNVEVVRSTVEDAGLKEGAYDMIFVRWVLNFVQDRKGFLDRLAACTRSGGVIAVMDYWYEGLSVHPRGTPFDRIPDIAREYYRFGGGDAYGIADMPAILSGHGFEVMETTPLQLAGGNTSGVFRWASQFFTEHLPIMAGKGIITADERDEQIRNFTHLASRHDMLFFSPVVLACAMRRGGA